MITIDPAKKAEIDAERNFVGPPTAPAWWSPAVQNRAQSIIDASYEVSDEDAGNGMFDDYYSGQYPNGYPE